MPRLLPALLALLLSAAAPVTHRGGTLRLLAEAGAGTIDPQINYEAEFWQVFVVAYDGLVAFRKTGGSAGEQIVPDLAAALPTASDGGRSYVFHLRRGVTFSNGHVLTPEDVAASFRRIFRVHAPNAGTWYAGIVGAEDCLQSAARCTLAGGVVPDDHSFTVTFHLTAPDPEFLDKLAVPHASILPADTPAEDAGTHPLPTTGPYRFASFDPNRGLRLVRNPYFREWSAEAQPDGYVDAIDYRFGLAPEAETSAVENGAADWMAGQPPGDRLAEIGTRYAAQVHIDPLFAIVYLAMNVNLPPFDRLAARQAVNFAVDRNAVVALFGGRAIATPSCQILPPGFPGYEPYCPYTENPGTRWTAPDLARARERLAASGTAGQRVTLIAADGPQMAATGQYLQSVLRALGYDAELKLLSHNIAFTYIQNTANKVQISLTDWYQDYPAPSDFLEVLFSCASFHPGSDASINISGFCSKPIDAAMQHARATALSDPAAANREWARIDRAITDQSPAAVLAALKRVDLVSARLGHFTFSHVYNMIFSEVWVQ